MKKDYKKKVSEMTDAERVKHYLNKPRKQVKVTKKVIDYLADKIVEMGSNPLKNGAKGIQELLEELKNAGEDVPSYSRFWQHLNKSDEDMRKIMRALHLKDVAAYENIEKIIAESKKDDYYTENGEVIKDESGRVQLNQSNVKRLELYLKTLTHKLTMQNPIKYASVKEKIALEQHSELTHKTEELLSELKKINNS